METTHWAMRARAAALAMLIAGLAACSEGDPIEQADAFLASAEKAIAEERYQAGLIEVKNAVQAAPDYAPARLTAGRLYLRLYDMPSAEKELRRALDLGAEPAVVWPLLLRAMNEQDQWQEVVEVAGRLDPELRNTLPMRIVVGRALIELERLDDAEATLGPAQTATNSELLAVHARLAASRRNLDEFRELVARAVDSTSPAADAYFFQAQLNVVDQDLAAAREAMEKALEVEPFSPRINDTLSVLLVSLGELEAAEEVIARASRRGSISLTMAHLRSAIALARQDFEQAKTLSEEILAKAPGFQPTLLVAGLSNAALSNDLLAVEYLERVRPWSERIAALIGRALGLAYVRLEEPAKALEALEKMPAGQANAEAQRLAITAALRAGETQKARERLRALAEAQPEDLRLSAGLAAVQLATGEIEGARETLEKVSKAADDLSVQDKVRLGLLQLRAGQGDQVLAIAEEIKSGSENPAAGFVLAGLFYAGQNELEKAATEFQGALEQDPDNGSAALALAILRQRQGDTAAAEAVLKQGLQNSDDERQLLTPLIQVMINNDRLDDAVTLLEQRIESDADAVEARYVLARVRMAQQRPEAAEALMVQALRSAPDRVDLVELYAMALWEQEKVKPAKAQFEKLVNLVPDSIEAKILLARVQLVDESLQAALATIDKAIAQEPDNLAPQLVRAGILADQNEWAQARFQVDRLLEQAPESREVLRLAARVAFSQNRFSDAEGHLQTLLDLEPESQALVDLSRVKARRGQLQEAETLLKGWLKDNPDDNFVRLYLSSHYLEKSDYAAAWETFQAMPEEALSNALVLNNAAWAALQIDRLPDAERMARRALQQQPDNPQIMDTLGMVRLKQGDVSEARELLQAAAEATSNPDIRFHLAQALEAAGQTDEARRVLRAIVDQPFDQQEQARQLLQRLR